MITIIRLNSQEEKDKFFEHILSRVIELRAGIRENGQLLYLTKRAKHDDVSLFVHTVDQDSLGDFMSDHLNKVEHITNIWVINLIKPIFYPLPRDTKNLKRFSLSLKVFPEKLNTVYQSIESSLSAGLKLVYKAYTFHLFGDSIQFSLLSGDEKTLYRHVTDVVNSIPGVLNTTVNLIDRTKPLVSYDDWKQYSATHGIVPSWNTESMVNQFQQ
jgi:hypothetical protein